MPRLIQYLFLLFFALPSALGQHNASIPDHLGGASLLRSAPGPELVDEQKFNARRTLSVGYVRKNSSQK